MINDKYNWQDEQVLLGSLTRACKLVNDKVHMRQPIHCSLLEMILFEVKRTFSNTSQLYLMKLYLAMFSIGYYGLLRVGELAQSEAGHAIKACDIHIVSNKNKILIYLYSSKNLNPGSLPQKVHIIANQDEKSGKYRKRNFCPFHLLQEFLWMRGDYMTENEPLFIFRDGSPVKCPQVRKTLWEAISKLGLPEMSFDVHSLRIGRSSDLIKYRYSIEEVKRMGRWRSNAVFKYIR